MTAPRPAAPGAGSPPLTTADLEIVLARHVNGVWSLRKLLALCLGWRAGESTVALGDRLGVGKNAVTGKVHRLKHWHILEPRPSPVRAAVAKPVRIGKSAPTLPPPLDSSPPRNGESALVAAPPRFGRVRECCWPIGRPGQATFRFCEAPTDPGRPYCGQHARRAYVQLPRPRRDGAASPAP
jgi:GcrA cell cycle regulator